MTNRLVWLLVLATCIVACSPDRPMDSENSAVQSNAYDGSFFKRAVFVVSDLERALWLWRDVLGFEANAVNDLTGKDSYLFDLMNVPASSEARTVTFNAGNDQIRTMLLLELPAIRPLPRGEVHRSTVVVNANGRFDTIMAAVAELGLPIKDAHQFVTADGDDAIEQGFLDWDGNLILLYEIRN